MSVLIVAVLVCGGISVVNGQLQWVMPRSRALLFPQQLPLQVGCYDTAINCLENYYFCNQPYYESVMRRQCARTCQFCQEIPDLDFSSIEVCDDVNPECRIWISRGFCESFLYPGHIKRRYCALSCGYCRRPVEEPRPEQPFADEILSEEQKHRKTTTPSSDEDAEESTQIPAKKRQNQTASVETEGFRPTTSESTSKKGESTSKKGE